MGDIFEFLSRENPELDRANANMETEWGFLHDVLSQWFKPNKALDHLVGNLYTALSSDVTMALLSREGPGLDGLK